MIKQGPHTYGHVIPRGVESDCIVGDYCSIADGVIVDCGFGHRTDFISTWPFDVFWTGKPAGVNNRNTGTTKGPVLIGNDVWIGEGAVIMSGVTIHDGAVIGLHAVVTRDVAPYSIVAGVPARHVRYRFPQQIIDRLLKSQWWSWPEDRVKSVAHLLASDRLEEFFKVAGV